MQKHGENKVADQRGARGRRRRTKGLDHIAHSRSRACTHVKASDRSSRLATPPHSVCLFRKTSPNNAMSFVYMSAIRSIELDRCGTHTHHHHLQAKKEVIYLQVPHRIMIQQVALVCTHGRIFHRLGFGLLARCCLPA